MCLDASTRDDAVRIPLYRRDGSIRGFVVIDAADADWANRWRWRQDLKGYAVRGERRGGVYVNIYLHRELLSLPRANDGRDVDHIDRDKLNCRRRNLRVINSAANHQNVSSYLGSASRHRGVTWHKGSGKWQARVQVNGRSVFVGRYATEDDAAAAVRVARRTHLPFSVD